MKRIVSILSFCIVIPLYSMGMMKQFVGKYRGRLYVRQSQSVGILRSRIQQVNCVQECTQENNRATIAKCTNNRSLLNKFVQQSEPTAAYTDGLIGCLATMLYVEQPETILGHLAHFAPGHNDEHRAHVQAFLRSKEVNAAQLSKVRLVIAVPGSYIFPDNEEIRYPERTYQQLVHDLVFDVERALEKQIEKDGTLFSSDCVPYGLIPPVGKAYHCAGARMHLDPNESTCEINNLGIYRKIVL